MAVAIVPHGSDVDKVRRKTPEFPVRGLGHYYICRENFVLFVIMPHKCVIIVAVPVIAKLF